MPFPSTPLLDDFNRANGALGASWASPAFGDNQTLAITGNQVSCGSGAGGGCYLTQFVADQECWVTIPTLPTAGNWVILDVRCNTYGGFTSNYQMQWIASTGAALIRLQNPNATTLTSWTQVLSAGDSIGLQVIGTTLTAWYKAAAAGVFSQLASTSNSVLNYAGYIGMEIEDTTARLDNFGGGGVGLFGIPQPMIGLS
jgi:hypothetical protein